MITEKNFWESRRVDTRAGYQREEEIVAGNKLSYSKRTVLTGNEITILQKCFQAKFYHVKYVDKHLLR
jgi:hypothetical protein